MPAFDYGANLRDGFQLFLASLLYGALGCVALVLFVVILGATGGGIIVIPLLLLLLGLMFLLGWAYYIGMARYAAGQGRGALLAVGQNFGMARTHWRKGLALTGWSILLGLLYQVVNNVVSGIIGGAMAADIVLNFAIVTVVFFAINYFQHFSSQHLIAQYAMAVGIVDVDADKDKFGYD